MYSVEYIFAILSVVSLVGTAAVDPFRILGYRFVKGTGARGRYWLAALVIGGGAVAATFVVGSPDFLITDESYVNHRLDPDISTYEAALGAFVGGAVAFTVGLGNRPKYRRVKEAEDADANLASDELSVVSGTVEFADETLTSPYGGEDACWFRATVSRPSRLMPGDRRLPVDAAEECVPFYVADDTGRVLVDPSDAEMLTVGSRNTTNDVLDTVDVDGGRADYRYGEAVLGPGDDVTVVGVPVTDSVSEYPDRRVIRAAGDVPTPLIFPWSESPPRETLWNRGVRPLGGGVLALISYGVMLATIL